MMLRLNAGRASRLWFASHRLLWLYQRFTILHQSLYNFPALCGSTHPESGLSFSTRHERKASAFTRRTAMAPNVARLRRTNFFNLAKTKSNLALALTTTLFLTAWSFAQQPTPPDSPVASAASTTSIAVPAGTRIALVLTQPIQTRHLRRGDDIYAQITSPVTAGNEAVIPPGTFVQGKVDKIGRHGGRGEVRLQSRAITFPDGYTIPAEGPITLESPDGYALKDPGSGRAAGAIALPLAGVGAGALIGHASANSSPGTITSSIPAGCTGPPPGCLTSSLTTPGNTAKGTMIGAAVGGTIGMVASIVLLTSSHNFFLDVGSPVEMVLQHSLTLPRDEVADAILEFEQHPVPAPPVAQRPRPRPITPDDDPGMCYTPGTPGTPDTDIPGTPGIGDSPGTPSIHIPGIPATPPTAHPCP